MRVYSSLNLPAPLLSPPPCLGALKVLRHPKHKQAVIELGRRRRRRRHTLHFHRPAPVSSFSESDSIFPSHPFYISLSLSLSLTSPQSLEPDLQPTPTRPPPRPPLHPTHYLFQRRCSHTTTATFRHDNAALTHHKDGIDLRGRETAGSRGVTALCLAHDDPLSTRFLSLSLSAPLPLGSIAPGVLASSCVSLRARRLRALTGLRLCACVCA